MQGKLDQVIEAALMEDIGERDITSGLTVPPDVTTDFVLRARQDLVACGVAIAMQVFEKADMRIQTEPQFAEGDVVKAGEVMLSGSGPAHAVLTAERVALNYLQYLCGIATETRKYVDAIAGCKAVILDTRKTLPQYRSMAKYAVKTGGGQNHRWGLHDGILIKDNHIALCGSLKEAVTKAKEGAPKGMRVEVECDTLEQAEEALAAGADMLLLDNMSTEQLRQAVAMVQGRAPLEASGNVNLQTVRAIAETGVDYISVGRLTHSVTACDIGLDMDNRYESDYSAIHCKIVEI